MKISITIIALSLSGCAVIEPKSVDLFLDHTSHIGQHFGSDTTDYGLDVMGLNAKWTAGRFALNVSDGIALESERKDALGERICGSFYGGKEVFNARLSYSLWHQ